jgi:hypothetical protein
MNDETKMLAEFNEGPFLLMKAMADLCQEKDRNEEAAGWRYMADNKRKPAFGKCGYSWIVSSLKADDPRTMPAFGVKRDSSHPLIQMTYGGENFDLSVFLQVSALFIGKLLKDYKAPVGKQKRRTYADMTPEEIAARRLVISTRTDLRWEMEDFYDDEVLGEYNRRAAYQRYTNAQTALSRITHPGTTRGLPSYEQWAERYRETMYEAEEAE